MGPVPILCGQVSTTPIIDDLIAGADAPCERALSEHLVLTTGGRVTIHRRVTTTTAADRYRMDGIIIADWIG